MRSVVVYCRKLNYNSGNLVSDNCSQKLVITVALNNFASLQETESCIKVFSACKLEKGNRRLLTRKRKEEKKTIGETRIRPNTP